VNLQRTVSDLKTELLHEHEIRTGLEESKEVLTQHAHDMELAVKQAEEQVTIRDGIIKCAMSPLNLPHGTNK